MRSPVAELLAAFAAAADRLGARWYLFGAQAALLYGAARLTADADEFVERTRVVLLVHRATGMPLDVVLAGRAKDLDDAVAILAANEELDLAAVRSTLRLLEQALDQSDLSPVLERLLVRR